MPFFVGKLLGTNGMNLISENTEVSIHIINTSFSRKISRKICCILTSQPDAGGSPSQLGGGPPYFRCPVVTSSLYPVRLRISLILSSSGPFAIKAELPFVVVTPVKNK